MGQDDSVVTHEIKVLDWRSKQGFDIPCGTLVVHINNVIYVTDLDFHRDAGMVIDSGPSSAADTFTPGSMHYTVLWTSPHGSSTPSKGYRHTCYQLVPWDSALFPEWIASLRESQYYSATTTNRLEAFIGPLLNR